MPRSSKSHSLISDAALGSLAALGERLKQARLRRNWTQALTAQKAGLSESSVKKVESGSARITFSAYLALLDLYGVAHGLDRLLADGDDPIGEALARSNQRQRARDSGTAAAEDEWDF